MSLTDWELLSNNSCVILIRLSNNIVGSLSLLFSLDDFSTSSICYLYTVDNLLFKLYINYDLIVVNFSTFYMSYLSNCYWFRIICSCCVGSIYLLLFSLRIYSPWSCFGWFIVKLNEFTKLIVCNFSFYNSSFYWANYYLSLLMVLFFESSDNFSFYLTCSANIFKFTICSFNS